MKTLSSRWRLAHDIVIDEEYERPPRNTDPGTASNFYKQFSRIVRRAAEDGVLELPTVLYARVSSRKQDRSGNAAHQLSFLDRRVHRIGERYGVTIKILDEFSEDV